jgi:menaquinone-9 beta-reductase
MSDGYDAVVVGAGPAGTTAAYTLGKNGFRVLLLDKEKFPRKKLCGGCLTAKTIKLMERVFGESEKDLVQRNIIDTQSNRYGIRYKFSHLIELPSDFTFHFVDRRVYDDTLLQKAVEVGTDVAEAVKVTDLQDSAPGKYRLITSDNRCIDADYIIAADGANSLLRSRLYRLTGRDNHLWHRNMAYCIEITAERTGPFKDLNFPILSFGYLRYGYAWLFPNKDKLVAGIGGLRRKNGDIAPAFRQFLSDYSIDYSGDFKKSGHPLPYGNFIKKNTSGNILFAGDAAGLVDPMLGEGIYQAHKSGELAAKAILEARENDSDAGANYSRSLQKYLFPEFVYARRWRRFLFNPVNHHLLKYSSTKWVEGQFHRLVEVIHGTRTYRWFKHSMLD